uniref:Uncharacterized protein n=1 Tax=Glossina palpalis gambiensis TaxID=67801 RepID=A0A1B0BF15_9MUSC
MHSLVDTSCGSGAVEAPNAPKHAAVVLMVIFTVAASLSVEELNISINSLSLSWYKLRDSGDVWTNISPNRILFTTALTLYVAFVFIFRLKKWFSSFALFILFINVRVRDVIVLILKLVSLTIVLTVSVGVIIVAVAVAASVEYVVFPMNFVAVSTVLSAVAVVLVIVVIQNDVVRLAGRFWPNNISDILWPSGISLFAFIKYIGSACQTCESVSLDRKLEFPRDVVGVGNGMYLEELPASICGGMPTDGAIVPKIFRGICRTIPLGLPTMTSELAVITSPGRMGIPPFCIGIVDLGQLVFYVNSVSLRTLDISVNPFIGVWMVAKRQTNQ